MSTRSPSAPARPLDNPSGTPYAVIGQSGDSSLPDVALIVWTFPEPVTQITFDPEQQPILALADGSALVMKPAATRIARLARLPDLGTPPQDSGSGRRAAAAHGQILLSLMKDGIRWRPDASGKPDWQVRATLGRRPGARATRLSGHPRSALAAVGYDDGAIMVIDLFGDREVLLCFETGAAITAVAWAPDGETLYAADQFGRLGAFDFSKVGQNRRSAEHS